VQRSELPFRIGQRGSVVGVDRGLCPTPVWEKEGVLFIGRAQEKRRNAEGLAYPWIVKATGVVNHFSVYAVDTDFGAFS
jgi:hypothetical protein